MKIGFWFSRTSYVFDASVIQSFGPHNMWQSGFNPIKCGVPLAKHGNRTLVLVGVYGPTAAMRNLMETEISY